MSEVRPAVGDHVSVGQFKTLKPMTIVNCFEGHDSGINVFSDTENRLYEPDAADREKAIWNDIDRSFSEPIKGSDSSADYAPTQIIAELFRSKGLDGIAYKIHLGGGYNVALFDVTAADIINCFLFEMESIDYKFKETANPYFVSKYCEQKEKAKNK